MLQPHIQLDETINVNKAILVGDPARLDVLYGILENSRDLTYNREFRSIIGNYKGEVILGLSTGVGAPSTAIAVEELKQIGIEYIIRVGSAGSYQSNIGLGELIIATSCVRDDGLTYSYVPEHYPATPDIDLLIKAKKLSSISHFGMIRSHDGFYMDNNSEVESKWSKLGVLGADMETSTVFTLGSVRSIKTLSILNNVVFWGKDLKEGINDLVNSEQVVKEGEKSSLLLALDIFALQS